MKIWDVRFASVSQEDGGNYKELNELLSEGWEPFAVTSGRDSEPGECGCRDHFFDVWVYHLRKVVREELVEET